MNDFSFNTERLSLASTPAPARAEFDALEYSSSSLFFSLLLPSVLLPPRAFYFLNNAATARGRSGARGRATTVDTRCAWDALRDRYRQCSH